MLHRALKCAPTSDNHSSTAIEPTMSEAKRLAAEKAIEYV